MLDHVGPVVVPATAAATCPACGVGFTPRRSNQRFCGRACAKASTRNAKRASRKIADSPAAKRRAEERRHRAFLLNDELYRKRPTERPAFMEVILATAREHDRGLHALLQDSRPLRVFGLDYAGRPNLWRTLDDYCRRTRDARLWKVIALEWEQPSGLSIPGSYRDPFTPPEGDVEAAPEVYIRRDPAEFFTHVRAVRAGEVPPPCRAHAAEREAAFRAAYADEVGMDSNINAPL